MKKMNKAVAFQVEKKDRAVRVINTSGLDILSKSASELLRAVADNRGDINIVWDKKVINLIGNHVGTMTKINNIYYYAEPNPLMFAGVVKITEAD